MAHRRVFDLIAVATAGTLFVPALIAVGADGAPGAEASVMPADRVTHYRACEHLNAQCVGAIPFSEGTQSYYFRWKQCDQARKECLKHPVPQSALDVVAEEARQAAADELRESEKAAAAAAERAAREERVFPELATEAEIAAYNATAAPDDQLVCRPQQLTGSHRTLNVCRTRREIRETEERAQEELRRDRLKTPGTVPGT